MTTRAATRNPFPHRAAYPDNTSECAAPFAFSAPTPAARPLTAHSIADGTLDP